MDAAPNWQVELKDRSDEELQKIVAVGGKSTKAKWAAMYLQSRQLAATVIHQHLHVGEPPPVVPHDEYYHVMEPNFWRRVWNRVTGKKDIIYTFPRLKGK